VLSQCLDSLIDLSVAEYRQAMLMPPRVPDTSNRKQREREARRTRASPPAFDWYRLLGVFVLCFFKKITTLGIFFFLVFFSPFFFPVSPFSPR
jgi:hypothetical protein